MKQRRGFTLIELLVVIAIIAILAAILFPVFAKARENARKSNCLSNLKQMGTAVMQYVQDYDERYPYSAHSIGGTWYFWYQDIAPYLKSTAVQLCPSASVNTNVASATIQYGYNAVPQSSLNGLSATAMAQVNKPAECPIICDCYYATVESVANVAWISNPVNASTGRLVRRHSDGFNITYADGHTKWVKEIPPLTAWDPTK